MYAGGTAAMMSIRRGCVERPCLLATWLLSLDKGEGEREREGGGEREERGRREREEGEESHRPDYQLRVKPACQLFAHRVLPMLSMVLHKHVPISPFPHS